MAEAAAALMVIDEADAIMQQRSQSARGGGALVTGVAYLLTRLERYHGVLVATTNRTEELDDAFFRRFDDFLVVPLPDEQARARLWSLMLGGAPPPEPPELELLGWALPGEMPSTGHASVEANLSYASTHTGWELPAALNPGLDPDPAGRAS